MNNALLLLGSPGDATNIVYHALAHRFGVFPAVIEEPVPRAVMLRTRVRKLGLRTVASQVAFMLAVRPILARKARSRIAQIARDNGFDVSPIPDGALHRVASVNAQQTVDLIARFQPRVIVVNGTRIIAKRVLESTSAPFINTHAGITPAYRGAHGGYWALLNNDPAKCGVTIHLVDPGIDTGEIIAQATIRPTPEDNFVTYPYLQTAAALPLLTSAIEAALQGSLRTRPSEGSSAVWYHPGLFQYVGGALRGVW
jgi:folate-dependent phosphoribosylglycinamide formyltransferase PurN